MYSSSIKSLPGGGSQGTLLGLFLFLVLIKEAGFEVQENKLWEAVNNQKEHENSKPNPYQVCRWFVPGRGYRSSNQTAEYSR